MVHLSKYYTFGEMQENTSSQNEINQLYGNRIRVRSCGVLIENEKILLLKHEHIGSLGYFWNVPGGSPEEGESLKECLIREFKEEVNLNIKVGNFLYLNEYVKPPLHAIECYFKVYRISGTTQLGTDPEMNENQILSELRWMDKVSIEKLPKACKPTFIADLWKS